MALGFAVTSDVGSLKQRNNKTDILLCDTTDKVCNDTTKLQSDIVKNDYNIVTR
jgi:hypothetical protein